MKIFEENGKIRFQLMHMEQGKMLFDFTIEKEEFDELKKHIIRHLEAFENE